MKTARELAQEAMDQCGGDVLVATELLEGMANNDADVWHALTADRLKTACYDACRGICRGERRVIWNSPGYDAGGKGERIKQHSATLMDWPLPGGKKLRDANKDDLLEAAGFYSAQASKMQAVSMWLERVADKVKSKTVGQTLTDDQLRSLRDESGATESVAA